MTSQPLNWPNWQNPPPPPPPPPAAFPVPVHGASFHFPPSPHPTVHDAEDDSTEGTCSEDESYDGSEGETDDEAEEVIPNVGRPRDFIPFPGRAQALGNHGILVPQQPPRLSAPNLPAARPPPPPPFAHSQPAFSPNQASNAPGILHRPQPAAHWSNVVPPPPPPPPGPVAELPMEISAVDRKWGMLFDHNDLPTKRWEQVIRGIGNCLMGEFMPRATLVITPGQMTAFYSQHRLELEVFPFTEVFRNRAGAPPARLAELYQQLACEYYLVPAEAQSRPTVPGLTLSGWTRWMTLIMRAYPDEESHRLAKVVAALPINADSLLDSKPERLPKQISRRLLPEKADHQARALVNNALRTHLAAVQPLSPVPGRAPPVVLHQIPNDAERRDSYSRYRPGSIPSPPPSQEADDDSQRRRTDRDRDRTYHTPNNNNSVRTYESNATARRDPVPALRTAATSPTQNQPTPPAPIPRIRPSSLSRPPAQHRHSVAGPGGDVIIPGAGGRGGRTAPERGYTWPYLPPRSGSESDTVRRAGVESRPGERDRDREQERDRESARDRDRERDRERERNRRRESIDGDRDRARDREGRGSDRKTERDRLRGKEKRDRESDRARDIRQREREREKEREANLRDRQRERERERERGRDNREEYRDRRERPREHRRSASVAGYPGRRGSGGMPKTPVVVKNDRAAPTRNQTWGEFLGGK